MADPVQLTARETELAILAWKAIENNQIKIDMQKLANLAGLKNIATARVTWYPLKKKLLAGAKASTETPKKRPAPEAGTAGATDENQVDPTPTKKARGHSSKKAVTTPSDSPGPAKTKAAKQKPVTQEEVDKEEANDSDGESI